MRSKNKKEFYQVTYAILPKKSIKWVMKNMRPRGGDYKFTSLKRLKTEIGWLEELYAGRNDWKVKFGPIFHCVEI